MLPITVPIDFVNATPFVAIPEINANGVAVPANVKQTSAWMRGEKWRECTANIIIAADATTTGTLTLQGCNARPPYFDTADFIPLGFQNLPNSAATINVNGNGNYLTDVILICYEWLQWVWTPSAGTTGTIQGTMRFQAPT